MVIIDRFYCFIYAIPLVAISSEECVNGFIHNWVALCGCPKKIFCDRGTQLTSSLWHEMCRFLGCQIKHSTAYHPQAQGLAERLNRSLNASLRAYEEPSQWYHNLPWVLLALRKVSNRVYIFYHLSTLFLVTMFAYQENFLNPRQTLLHQHMITLVIFPNI